MDDSDTDMAVTIVTEDGEREVAGARLRDGDLWLPADALTAAIGWTLKPEGLCRDAMCVPVPRGREAAFVDAGRVNVAALWRLLERPFAHSATGDLWAFGANARERADALLSLEAPDFTLPDLAGVPHTLSDFRGRKVFLVTWASW